MNDTKTVSGAIVHVTDADEAPLVRCLVDITPKQSGTGTPSPSNVRAISGWESVNVYVSPTEDEADGHTTTTSLGRTVYGGTLDVVSGLLTVDKGIVTFDGSSDETFYTGSSGMPFRVILSDANKPSSASALAGIVSNQMTEVTQSSIWGTAGACAMTQSSTRNVYFKLADGLTDISALRTYLASNPLQVCYELATPQTYTLTGQEVETLLGDNNVWADAGDIEITYHTDTLGIYNKIYIDGRPYFRPNDFEIKREDVYAGEYTTCTGKLIADKIGWKYSDLPMKWDILPDEDLVYLTTLTGAFDLIFRDSDGQHTETVIRKGFTNTPTRITGPEGSKIWTGIEMEVAFLNTHPIDE